MYDPKLGKCARGSELKSFDNPDLEILELAEELATNVPKLEFNLAENHVPFVSEQAITSASYCQCGCMGLEGQRRKEDIKESRFFVTWRGSLNWLVLVALQGLT
jgi:hypothetical protein